MMNHDWSKPTMVELSSSKDWFCVGQLWPMSINLTPGLWERFCFADNETCGTIMSILLLLLLFFASECCHANTMN